MTVRSLKSVHRPRYFRFCNVLHIWTIRAIPTYRVGNMLIMERKSEIVNTKLSGFIYARFIYASCGLIRCSLLFTCSLTWEYIGFVFIEE